MEHLSEVLRILEAAISHDSAKAIDYATLLADKLEQDHQVRQASAVRSRLSKASVRTFAPASAAALPIDDATGLPTVDVQVEWTVDSVEPLVLHPLVESQLTEFLDGVARYDFWHSRGIEVPNRLLLHGPPGTGKTSIARHVAASLELPLLVSRSDTLVSSLLGQTSKNIRQIFDFAQARPCVLFLDEFDALAKARSDSREIGELQRVVIALLQNIDAFPESSVLLAATNHPELLDRAAWRRFGASIEIELPDPAERRRLWTSFLGSLADDEEALKVVVEHSDGMSPAAIRAASSDMVRHSILRGNEVLDPPMVLRRLLRHIQDGRHDVYKNLNSEIGALRAWAPRIFSIRVLADEFQVSTRQVQNALKE